MIKANDLGRVLRGASVVLREVAALPQFKGSLPLPPHGEEGPPPPQPQQQQQQQQQKQEHDHERDQEQERQKTNRQKQQRQEQQQQQQQHLSQNVENASQINLPTDHGMAQASDDVDPNGSAGYTSVPATKTSRIIGFGTLAMQMASGTFVEAVKRRVGGRHCRTSPPRAPQRQEHGRSRLDSLPNAGRGSKARPNAVDG